MTSTNQGKFRRNWKTIVILTIMAVINVALIQKTLLMNKYGYLINSIEEVSNGTYSDQYQCLEFSGELQKKLKEQGIESKISIVEREGRTGEFHAVVSVQIEPQTGEAVSYKTVDNCADENGTMVCENGTVEGRNMYIANKI
jgi:hypothetical protein